MLDRAQLFRQLDYVYELYIKKRDGYACVLTGSKRNISLFRLIDTDNFVIRYDVNNGCLLKNKEIVKYRENSVPILSYYMDKLGWDYITTLGATRYRPVSNRMLLNKIQEIVALTDPIRDRERWDD